MIFLFQPENCSSIPSSVLTKTIDIYNDEENDEYDDDFKFISNFGKSYKKLLEGINKI
jgi:hypothetical protein